MQENFLHQQKQTEEKCFIDLRCVTIEPIKKVLHKPSAKKMQPITESGHHSKTVKRYKKRVSKKVKIPSVEKKVVKKTVVQTQPKHKDTLVAVQTNQEGNCTKKVVCAVTRKNKNELYLKLHRQKITTLIRENLYYPRRARRQHIEGEVLLNFEITQEGRVRNIQVRQATKKILANAAVQTIKDLDGIFPQPDETIKITIPIEYTLKR